MTGLTASSQHISASWIGSRCNFLALHTVTLCWSSSPSLILWNYEHLIMISYFFWFFSASINHWKPTYLWPTVWLHVNHGKSLKIMVNHCKSTYVFSQSKTPISSVPWGLQALICTGGFFWVDGCVALPRSLTTVSCHGITVSTEGSNDSPTVPGLWRKRNEGRWVIEFGGTWFAVFGIVNICEYCWYDYIWG